MALMLSNEQDRSPLTGTGLAPRRGAVMVVEDDDAMRRLLVDALRDEGHDVVEVADGHLAMHLLSNGGAQTYDVIVTDHRMRRVSGMDLLNHLRTLGGRAALVLISAFADQGLMMEAGSRGAAAVLAKPFSLPQLLNTVRSLAAFGRVT